MSTEISWTDETLNFLAGCSKVSAGCRNCYAINMAHRLPAMAKALEAKGKNSGRLAAYEGLTKKGDHGIDWTGKISFIPEALQQPYKWKKPRKIFVNSMSDCFHESVKDEWLDQFFAVAALTPRHTYQILTKRPERMLQYLCYPERQAMIRAHLGMDDAMCWPLPNVWLGVTVENQKAADERIPLLLRTPASIRFLSCEPLLEKMTVSLWLNKGGGKGWVNGSRQVGTIGKQLDWLIIGGESGNSARLCNVEWIRFLVNEGQKSKVPVWVKQMGSKVFSPKNPMWDNSITGKGTDQSEWPEDLRVREFPEIAA